MAGDRTLNLISSAYRAAVEPDAFLDLLSAWDDWLEPVIASAEAAFAEVEPVFADALDVADRLDKKIQSSGRGPLDTAPAPAAIFDDQDKVIKLNTVATAFLEREGLEAQAFVDIAKRALKQADADEPPIYRLEREGDNRSYFIVDAPASDAIKNAYPSASRVVLLSQIDWSTELEANLHERLSLSGAELRVARALLEGLTAQEIADTLNRSLPTVRSHIKVLLQKTGTRRQSELVQLLTILRHVYEADDSATEGKISLGEFETSQLSAPMGELPLVRYGMGKSLIYFTTSSRPEETKPVRAAFRNAGLRVLAPVRPGFASAPQKTRDANDELLDGWLTALHETSDKRPVIAGHREGGVVAIKAARRLIEKGRKIDGVVLISTGAPVASWGQWRQSPPSVRRSFLAAHYAPLALTLGYQTAVRLFKSGEAGQDQIINYFFADSPSDMPKLDDPYYYEVTRANLDFCFNNVGQIVRDIALWGSNWASDLARVAEAVPVLFIHGTDHNFFPIEQINDLTLKTPSTQLMRIERSGQLALYDQPDLIAKAIAARSWQSQ